VTLTDKGKRYVLGSNPGMPFVTVKMCEKVSEAVTTDGSPE
jgi:hypothetical protein